MIEYQDTPLGMMNVQTRQVGEHVWVRTVDSILPNANQTGAIWEEAEAVKAFQRCAMLRWMVPVDDTATRTVGWRFFSPRLDPRGQDDPERVGRESIDFVGQSEDERPYEERQRQPGEWLFHASGQGHAMRTARVPLLAMVAWVDHLDCTPPMLEVDEPD